MALEAAGIVIVIAVDAVKVVQAIIAFLEFKSSNLYLALVGVNTTPFLSTGLAVNMTSLSSLNIFMRCAAPANKRDK